MKKLLSLLAVALLGFTSVFAAYQPSQVLEDTISSAGDTLITIVDTQYDAQYQILIDLLSSYKQRFAHDEMKTWILDTLLMQVEKKISTASDNMMGEEANDDMIGKSITFDITGKNFSFSDEELVVHKGDTVTINFESTDGFHDWVVDAFDAATAQVTPGKITSVTFVADEAGSFEYSCSVGNHRAQGMVGTLVVLDTDMHKDMNDDAAMMMKMDMLEKANTLEHVAQGQTIRGISFDGSEIAKAATMTTDGMTHIYAEFMNLPMTDSNNFYEGRAVRKSPFDFVSTGELMMKDGMYIKNDWSVDADYSAYTHYVLTLEPRDNDPAPAEHIFEGDM